MVERDDVDSKASTVNSLSGALGIVLVPDSETQERSRNLAKGLLGSVAEYYLGASDLPHLTLYHGKLVDAPAEMLSSCVASVCEKLRGRSLRLQNVGFAGGNFLFWDVDWSSDPGALREGHLTALKLSKFLDRSVPAKATSEEKLDLSPEELQNIAEFGHPWVDALYRPHITLGFGVGLANANVTKVSEPWQMTVSDVKLARIGFPGRIESFVDLDRVR